MLQNITQLENDLWESADQLRANSKLTAGQYSMPVLGLIFLRHATTRFHQIEAEISQGLPTRGGKTRPLTSDDFKAKAAIFLPEEARYDHLVALPSEVKIGDAINQAMTLIEKEVAMLEGALPKTYHRFESDLLANLLRIFNRDALRKAEGDIFGRIYEYFLNKFAMTGAQEGGEFFTPPSLVRLIVNVIEPDHGKILDPACGSAGMAVQTGHFLQKRGENPTRVMTFYGQEKSDLNVNLAKMNLAVHGLEGQILQGNTYYEDHHGLVGQCDFVMANPPFNVDGIDPEKVKKDPRLFTKKTIPGVSTKTKAVSNGNYLWMQYFYSYLNERGRAGFVMASSASDAGHQEREIRREIIETGAVDVVIAIGTNFFYTRSLPCTLWFYDRGKPRERQEQTLMIDARHIYRVVTRKINDFSEEQLANLTAIVWLYRGETERYVGLVQDYLRQTHTQGAKLPDLWQGLDEALLPLTEMVAEVLPLLAKDKEQDQSLVAEVQEAWTAWTEQQGVLLSKRAALWADLRAEREKFTAQPPTSHEAQRASRAGWEPFLPRVKGMQKETMQGVKEALAIVARATKELGVTKLKAWDTSEARKREKMVVEAREEAVAGMKRMTYLLQQVGWLQSRFPEGVYADVLGLCKVVGRAEIANNDDSLTPGRYVGVAPLEFEEDDVFEERMSAIHLELNQLNNEAIALVQTINTNLEDLL